LSSSCSLRKIKKVTSLSTLYFTLAETESLLKYEKVWIIRSLEENSRAEEKIKNRSDVEMIPRALKQFKNKSKQVGGQK
jgi:hypothetical protein